MLFLFLADTSRLILPYCDQVAGGLREGAQLKDMDGKKKGGAMKRGSVALVILLGLLSAQPAFSAPIEASFDFPSTKSDVSASVGFFGDPPQAGYFFMDSHYLQETFDLGTPVTIQRVNLSLPEISNLLAENSTLTWNIVLNNTLLGSGSGPAPPSTPGVSKPVL